MSDDDGPTYVNRGQEFQRDTAYIPDRITQDERVPEHGPVEGELWPVEPGRYRLVAARACPWASRAIIVRRLLGLEDVDLARHARARPTTSAAGPSTSIPDGKDPVLGIERLQEAFFARYPDYDRGITVPAIVDVPTGQVVTNDFPWITHDLWFEWQEHHRPGAPDLWPADLRDEMDEVMERVYTEVNNGVYRCGFAGSQASYERAYARLWAAMDWLEERLADRRFLMGDVVTEADVRLFTTLVRFDAVYHGHFKCNRNKLTEMPVLWAYARDLFQMPGFGETVDFDQIQRALLRRAPGHQPVAGSSPRARTCPAGPTPHGRESLGGKPIEPFWPLTTLDAWGTTTPTPPGAPRTGRGCGWCWSSPRR